MIHRIFGPGPIVLFIILYSCPVAAQKNYSVQYKIAGKDTAMHTDMGKWKTLFDDQQQAISYIRSLPSSLVAAGYAAASLDSLKTDSLSATAWIFPGPRYRWVQLNTDSVEADALLRSGWRPRASPGKEPGFLQVKKLQEQLIAYYLRTGYPFASVQLTDIAINNDEVSGRLVVAKGPLYHIDSIRVTGRVKISNRYLQQYLSIANGSIYNEDKLSRISKLLAELPFAQEARPWDLTMLGSGAVLNLYLEPKRSSEINVLIGFLPANNITQKSQLTADVQLNLKNALGAAENILFNWRQLEPRSPHLLLGYTHPYILSSNFGVHFLFDLRKVDSLLLELQLRVGLDYRVNAYQSLNVFFQNKRSSLLAGGIDLNTILATRVLPANLDVSSANTGIGYNFANTDYQFNPRRGSDIQVSAAAGIRKVQQNQEIISLNDPDDPSFDFKTLYDTVQLKSHVITLAASAAHYFDLRKNNVLKAAANAGWIQSPQLFQNEMFKLGGYRLLRGFDEESIYANRYLVLTLEYRYLLGINSYFYGFTDVGYTQTKTPARHLNNRFASLGAGIEFETKFGLLNLSYAVGKINDVKFDLRNASKIHFGYINYF